MKVAFTIRDAAPGDEAALHGLIHELAVYEKLTHLFTATPEQLRHHLFGQPRYAEALVAEIVRPDGAQAVGFALYFHNYSTFLAKPGLYLEDLFVLPEYRRNGIGEKLFRQVAARAVERGCGRFEWAVLDWNTPVLAFYRKLGATIMPEWQLCRVAGDTLRTLASSTDEQKDMSG
ncbi:GNAT family N-acetyltransferase [Chitinimonas lacunae]|uniref:GNAT family N-acetyltransferase n=1 Tax=Chitinimonas lacunae TaxID=1963018 RepID=A0ABV8MQ60_9NEIS